MPPMLSMDVFLWFARALRISPWAPCVGELPPLAEPALNVDLQLVRCVAPGLHARAACAGSDYGEEHRCFYIEVYHAPPTPLAAITVRRLPGPVSASTR